MKKKLMSQSALIALFILPSISQSISAPSIVFRYTTTSSTASNVENPDGGQTEPEKPIIPQIDINHVDSIDEYVGNKISYQFSALTEGTGLKWSSPNLNIMSLNLSENGLLSGDVVTTGEYPVTIYATNAEGATASVQVNINLYGKLTVNIPDGVSNDVLPGNNLQPYQFVATGGKAPFKWSLNSYTSNRDAGFDGITIDENGYLAARSIKIGMNDLRVEVEDALGNKHARTVKINSYGPFELSDYPFKDGMAGGSWNINVLKNRKEIIDTLYPDDNIVLSVNKLPEGLSYDGNSITGTIPKTVTPGVYDIDIELSTRNKNYNDKVKKIYKINVLPAPNPLEFAAAEVPIAYTDQNYSYKFHATTGFTSPVQWTMFPSISGLNLNSETGELTGIPSMLTETGPTKVTVTASQWPTLRNDNLQVPDYYDPTSPNPVSQDFNFIVANGMTKLLPMNFGTATIGQNYMNKKNTTKTGRYIPEQLPLKIVDIEGELPIGSNLTVTTASTNTIVELVPNNTRVTGTAGLKKFSFYIEDALGQRKKIEGQIELK